MKNLRHLVLLEAQFIPVIMITKRCRKKVLEIIRGRKLKEIELLKLGQITEKHLMKEDKHLMKEDKARGDEGHDYYSNIIISYSTNLFKIFVFMLIFEKL